MMEDRTNYIRVINRNKVVTGRYAGRDYIFKTGVPLDVPEVVAAHVFAFGHKDKTQALNRLGWARTSDEIESGLEKLGNVIFEEPPEMIEAPKKKGKKTAAPDIDEDEDDAADQTGTAGPPVTAGGTKGGGLINPSPAGPVELGGDGDF